MNVRTLSLVVTEPSADASALRAAAAIAIREDAHLDVRCLGLSPLGLEVDVAMPFAGAPGLLFEQGLAEADKRAAALVAWAQAGLPPEARASVEPVVAQLPGLGPAIARAARFSDLAVAAMPYEVDWHKLGPLVLEGLLFGSGLPVLVVPRDGIDGGHAFRRVVLGWDDSDAALRAARAALPLLAPGARVDVAVVGPSSHDPGVAGPGEALSLWLARHGFEAEVSVLARDLPRVADVLARFAADRGAEAIVMGGYGHSPFREAILGGPTRTLLRESRLPLVLAHR